MYSVFLLFMLICIIFVTHKYINKMTEKATLIAKEPESTFEPIEEGPYQAVCSSVIDTGTQTMTYNEESKQVRRIRVTWELSVDGSENRLIGKDYTLSLHEKAEMRKDLQTWLGRSLTDQEKEEGFDLFKMVGVAAKISVVNKAGQNGKTYSNVNLVLESELSFSPENTPFGYSINNHDIDTYDLIPEFIQNRIKVSAEGKAIFPPL